MESVPNRNGILKTFLFIILRNGIQRVNQKGEIHL